MTMRQKRMTLDVVFFCLYTEGIKTGFRAERNIQFPSRCFNWLKTKQKLDGFLSH